MRLIELAQLNTSTKTKDKVQVFSLPALPGPSLPVTLPQSVRDHLSLPPTFPWCFGVWTAGGFSQADPSIPVSSG